MPLTFEWDLHKPRTNLVKHGIDPEHSVAEERYITIGRAFAGKLLVVVHTDKRVASRRERKFYEKNT